MAIDPVLLSQALRTPESQDVLETPIVRVVVLPDASNAAELVPLLGRPDSLESRNARRVLCAFGADAVPHVLAAAVTDGGSRPRRESLAVLWALLTGEDSRTTREALQSSAGEVAQLMSDARPLPDNLPEHVERDLTARVCDLTYIVVRELLDPSFDQSGFRSQDDDGRDRSIRQWQSSSGGSRLV